MGSIRVRYLSTGGVDPKPRGEAGGFFGLSLSGESSTLIGPARSRLSPVDRQQVLSHFLNRLTSLSGQVETLLPNPLIPNP